MTFRQFHYTSCANGPAGYSGYQFSAITPGTSAAVLREVEELTVYQPPPGLLVSPSDEPDAYPVAFLHAVSAATGASVTAQVVFAGTDYSGRPGNYFAHALVTSTPDLDFGSLLPAELWGADLWQRQPGPSSELPELPGPPPRGIVHRRGVQAFLDAQKADGILAALLTAVGSSLAGARPVLLASRDVTESAWWIAAVSYLLGDHLGRRLTFTTYSHRPGAARFHLIGVLSSALPPDADTRFQLFDLASGLMPAGSVHPLAAMLVDTGVIAAPGLWKQAAAFASGAEQSLDDWLAPVAVAAALFGRQLTPAEDNAVARWIGSDAGDRLPADVADVVLGVSLAQPEESLTEERLTTLHGLARRVSTSVHVAHIEDLLIERAITRISRGEPTAGVQLTSRGAEAAATRAAGLLDGATPATALAVLDWAAASGVTLPDARLEEYGRSCLRHGPPGAEMVQLLRRNPAVLRGFLTRLDGEPAHVAEAVLADAVGAGIGRDDVDGYPRLTELWLLQSAAQGKVDPLRALDEIADTRAWSGEGPQVDATLLSRLWPGDCPPDQIAELLGLFVAEPAQDATDWLVTQISAVAMYGAADAGWYRLAVLAAEHPVRGALPAATLQIMQNAARAGPLLSQARAAAPQGEANVFAELFALYRVAEDGRTRGLLERDLPALLVGAVPLGPALCGCPEGLVLAFSRELQRRLAAQEADIPLAARAFAAQADLNAAGQHALASQLAAAVDPVRGWRRRDLNALSRALGDDTEAARLLRAWLGKGPGWLGRILPGAGPDHPAESN
jgi:GTPase-associated protein 1, N-terminal domain type 2/GTPase-associated protein 1, middle domain/GTPase-associated protein 1, C-terminal domain